MHPSYMVTTHQKHLIFRTMHANLLVFGFFVAKVLHLSVASYLPRCIIFWLGNHAGTCFSSATPAKKCCLSGALAKLYHIWLGDLCILIILWTWIKSFMPEFLEIAFAIVCTCVYVYVLVCIWMYACRHVYACVYETIYLHIQI